MILQPVDLSEIGMSQNPVFRCEAPNRSNSIEQQGLVDVHPHQLGCHSTILLHSNSIPQFIYIGWP